MMSNPFPLVAVTAWPACICSSSTPNRRDSADVMWFEFLPALSKAIMFQHVVHVVPIVQQFRPYAYAYGLALHTQRWLRSYARRVFLLHLLHYPCFLERKSKRSNGLQSIKQVQVSRNSADKAQNSAGPAQVGRLTPKNGAAARPNSTHPVTGPSWHLNSMRDGVARGFASQTHCKTGFTMFTIKVNRKPSPQKRGSFPWLNATQSTS